MSEAWSFNAQQLEEALMRWPPAAPPNHARLLQATVRDFLSSDQAKKLRVKPLPEGPHRG